MCPAAVATMQTGPGPVLHARTDGPAGAAHAGPPRHGEGDGAGCGLAGNADVRER